MGSGILRSGARSLKRRMRHFAWFESILKWSSWCCVRTERNLSRNILVWGRDCGWRVLRESWRAAWVYEDCRGPKNSNLKTRNARRLSGCTYGKSFADGESRRGCWKRWSVSRASKDMCEFTWIRRAGWWRRRGCTNETGMSDARGTTRIRRRRFLCGNIWHSTAKHGERRCRAQYTLLRRKKLPSRYMVVTLQINTGGQRRLD